MSSLEESDIVEDLTNPPKNLSDMTEAQFNDVIGKETNKEDPMVQALPNKLLLELMTELKVEY